MERFYLTHTEDYSLGGPLSESSEDLLYLSTVSSTVLHLMQTKHTHQHDRVHSFKVSKETEYIDSETAGLWCLGREPYLPGSVNADTVRRDLLILIFKTHVLYLNA